MAKIRGFKPDLWTDDDFVEVTPLARLLWMGMWNFACDNGHLQDKPKQIKMRVLPTDDANCSDLLNELTAQGLIDRADGWITIPNLTAHQNPHKRWFVLCDKPGCEFPDGASYGYKKTPPTGKPPKVDASQPLANGCSTSDGDGDGDGDGDLTVMVTTTSSDVGKPTRATKKGTQFPEGFTPTDAHHATATELGVDIRAEYLKFRDYCHAHGKTYKVWNAAFSQWLRNATPQRRGGVVASVPKSPTGWLAAANELHQEEA